MNRLVKTTLLFFSFCLLAMAQVKPGGAAPLFAGGSPYAISYTATGASIAMSLQQTLDLKGVHIRSFGADPTGKKDSTAAFTAAVAYAHASGIGRVDVGGGQYALNGVVPYSNIHIVGIPGGSRSTDYRNCLTPWDPTKPVLQMADDTGAIYGTSLVDIMLYGVGPNGTGSVGLKIAGGYQESWIWGLSAKQFTGYEMQVGPGSVSPIQYDDFYHIDLQVHTSVASTAALGMYYGSGTSWNTATYFHGLHITGNALGSHVIENDSCFLWNEGGWSQSTTGGAYKVLHTWAPYPILAGDFDFETTGGSTCIESYDNTLWSAYYLQGNIRFSGTPQIKTLDGTLHNINNGTKLSGNSEMYNPHIVGAINLTSTSSTDPTETLYRLYQSSGVINLANGGTVSSALTLDNAGQAKFWSRGLASLVVSANANAVNRIGIAANATGSGGSIYAVGDDANIDLPLTPKGTGAVTTTRLSLTTVGGSFGIKTGTNAAMGTGTLVAGVATIATTQAVTATEIFLTRVSGTTQVGALTYTVTSGTSFTVTSKDSTGATATSDNGTFNWLIIRAL